ncbi:MAG TPA: hypothetical protein PK095_03170 [Myxococcota bacterium]|nr:hypothetical protein [Myxococcota bacterium]
MATVPDLILLATREPRHRLNRVAERDPTFFRRVSDVAEAGNLAVHEAGTHTSSDGIRAELHNILQLLIEA